MKPVEMSVFCPACGGLVPARDLLKRKMPDKKVTSAAGLGAGAAFGSSIGVAGAFGAATASAPLAIIGALAGYALPRLLRKDLECAGCGTTFNISRLGRKEAP